MKRLLLLGGGHTHVEVIRRFGADPPPDIQVVLVSPEAHTAYSGMLPGYVAGHYGFHDCHIDLVNLCHAAGVVFRRAAATKLDTVARRVACDDGSDCEYDLVSLDIGSTQPTHAIPGAAEHALRVKPVGHFIETWDAFRATVKAGAAPRRIVVVGAGAAGVELALSMHHRLTHDSLGASIEIHVVSDTPDILVGHPRGVQRLFRRIMQERRIFLHAGIRATRIEPGALYHEQGVLPAERVVLANGAAPAAWLRGTGLSLDANGFILVNGSLQSVSHADVFAAGDVASMAGQPRPKSGVFAVRQGPPLANNLRRALARQPLAPYRPQKAVLALISTGNRYAVASWRGFGVSGRWVWRWKNWIDCRFMATYRIDSHGNKQPA